MVKWGKGSEKRKKRRRRRGALYQPGEKRELGKIKKEKKN